MGVFGDTLRQARAHKGVTLREAEQATRISRHYLLALEEEHFEQLPALIYQRGIVKNYATYLDLDQSKLLKMYQEATGEEEPTESVVVGPGQQIPAAGGIVPNFAVIGFIVVLMSVVFVWGYSAYVASPDNTALTQSPPTVTTVSEDDRFIPSPTPPLPTATRKADQSADTGSPAKKKKTPTADAGEPNAAVPGQSEIFLATLTATAEPVEITLGGDTGASAVDNSVATDGVESQYSFSTTTDVYLTVIVDNVTLWDGNLAAGHETPFLPGSAFLVTFSGADSIHVVDGKGSQQDIIGPTVQLP